MDWQTWYYVYKILSAIIVILILVLILNLTM